MGLEVIDAATQTKVLDLGLRALQSIPALSDELIVFYNPVRPTRFLSLIPYHSTFFVRFEKLRLRASFQVVLAVLTAFGLLLESFVVFTAPVWSGMRMLP